MSGKNDNDQIFSEYFFLSYIQADGTWTRGDLPTCIPVQCDIPHHPLNGQQRTHDVWSVIRVTFMFRQGSVHGSQLQVRGELLLQLWLHAGRQWNKV